MIQEEELISENGLFYIDVDLHSYEYNHFIRIKHNDLNCFVYSILCEANRRTRQNATKETIIFYSLQQPNMRSVSLFKWKKGDHKRLNLYFNEHESDEYKWYLMFNFAQTRTSQDVWWKTVGVFKDAIESNFWISLQSWLDELWTIIRYMQRDRSIFKDKDKNKEWKWFIKQLIHKQWNSNKTMMLWQFETWWHSITLYDRNQKDFVVTFPLSSSEMFIIFEYCREILHHFRKLDVWSEQT